jgi:hypothetical protein
MGITIFTLVEGRLRASTELDDISDLLEAQTLFWLDATVRDEPLRALLSDKLKLHPLVVEDVLQERLHPKVEDFGEYLYLVVHGGAVHRRRPRAHRDRRGRPADHLALGALPPARDAPRGRRGAGGVPAQPQALRARARRSSPTRSSTTSSTGTSR